MKPTARFLTGLPLWVAVCLVLGAWTAAGADTLAAAVPAPGGLTRAAETASAVAAGEPIQHEAEHKIPKRAEKPTDKFPITNPMIVTWVVAALIIWRARRATRQMQRVPDRQQNFWEWIVESLQDFLEGMLGRELASKTFWFFATIFLLILTTNWFGLLPGFGTIGWGHQTPNGFVVTNPLLRGGNADLNMTGARTESSLTKPTTGLTKQL